MSSYQLGLASSMNYTIIMISEILQPCHLLLTLQGTFSCFRGLKPLTWAELCTGTWLLTKFIWCNHLLIKYQQFFSIKKEKGISPKLWTKQSELDVSTSTNLKLRTKSIPITAYSVTWFKRDWKRILQYLQYN